MTITAVIAEYNPFHNGHAYQLAKARELTGADYLVVIMSGDFVQRGAPAILDQHDRAELALLGGADLVLQLPCHFALGSAQHFARGAVSLLTALGCVDFLDVLAVFRQLTQLIFDFGIHYLLVKALFKHERRLLCDIVIRNRYYSLNCFEQFQQFYCTLNREENQTIY